MLCGGIMVEPIKRAFMESNWISTGFGKREKICATANSISRIEPPRDAWGAKSYYATTLEIKVYSQSWIQKKISQWFGIDWSTPKESYTYTNTDTAQPSFDSLKTKVTSLKDKKALKDFKLSASSEKIYNIFYEKMQNAQTKT